MSKKITSNITGPSHQFEPRRSVIWGVRLGYYHGQGLSSFKTAELLGDGTGPATVRTMTQRAKLPLIGRRQVIVPLNLEFWERDILQRHADERGITIHELLYRFVRRGLVLDDLYLAVTDEGTD